MAAVAAGCRKALVSAGWPFVCFLAPTGIESIPFQLLWAWGNSEHKQAAEEMGGSLVPLGPILDQHVFCLLKTVFQTEHSILHVTHVKILM